jgi:hypothetical protein
MKITYGSLIIVLLVAGISTGLTIKLPAEATVESENLTLGQIAVITGDESQAAKAGQVTLGKISLPGQKLTIDRTLIVSRLASSGIAANDTVITGAEKVIVSQKTSVIKGESFVESAASFLTANVKEPTISKWELVRAPAELVLVNRNQNIELKPRMVSRGANGQANVEVSVIADGQAAGTRLIAFRPKYIAQKTAATSDSDKAKTQKEPAIIERNQNVCIRIDKGGLVVTASGKAMQPGKSGEKIKVRNIDSQRVILAKVNEDGTVEPVF